MLQYLLTYLLTCLFTYLLSEYCFLLVLMLTNINGTTFSSTRPEVVINAGENCNALDTSLTFAH